MKRNLILTCLALLAACGGGDDGGSGDDGNTTGKKGKELTAAQLVEVCTAKASVAYSQTDNCDIGALGALSKDECVESRDSCRKFIDEEVEDESAGDVASLCKSLVETTPEVFGSCTGDVTTLKNCIKALNEQTRKFLGDNTCDNWEDAQKVTPPAACKGIPDDCHQLVSDF